MPRDRSSRSPAGLTVAALAQAAVEEVAQSGVKGLTMSRVADRLGVRAPSLYHHVRDKQALLQLVAAHALRDVTDDVAAYDAVGDLDAWLDLTRDGTLRLRRRYLAHPGLAQVVQATADLDREDRPDGRGALIRAQISALVRLGIPEPIAQQLFRTCAHWALAAVAADSSGPRPGDEATFERGLAWLHVGLRAELRSAST